jgi:hypothetical protein
MSSEYPPPIWWVRFKLGKIGLTQRTTHAVPVPDGFPKSSPPIVARGFCKVTLR